MNENFGELEIIPVFNLPFKNHYRFQFKFWFLENIIFLKQSIFFCEIEN